MTKKLFFEAISKFFLGVILVGILIFLPAGTFSYPGGWLLMGLLFIPMLFAGIIMMIKNPALLKHRLIAKETQKEQEKVIFLSAALFILGFLVSGLGVRFSIGALPKGVILSGVIIFLAGYILYGEALRENAYLSRTISILKDQKVIDTGLYSVVRHPMYLSALTLFKTMPLILGSFLGFLIFLLFPFIFVKRIKLEEAFLEKNLDGYIEYKQKVKYRLIPFVW